MVIITQNPDWYLSFDPTLSGVELSPTQPKDQLLKCHCSDCENKMCETDGYCYATIIIDSSGEKSIYK